MVGFLELAIVAATAQLAVLPGEKVQFIIAGLATRFNPLVVVAAASSAFAGWTVLELLLGEALQGLFAPWVLDAVTGSLFLLFAVLLYRSAPASGSFGPGGAAGGGTDRTGGPAGDADRPDAGVGTDHAPEPWADDEQESGQVADGGVEAVDLDVELLGREVEIPERFGTFLPIFLMMAAGEFGDKTQLVTIGLAVQYGAHPAIWAGEMAAIVPVSLANAFFFHRFAHRFDVRKAHFAGATLFLFFGLDTVLKLATGISIWEYVVGEVAAVLTAAVTALV